MWTIEWRDPVVLLRLVGECDVTCSTALGAELWSVLSDGSAVVVDLTDTVFVDGAIAHTLVSAGAHNPGQMAIVLPADASHPARKILVEVFGEESRAVVLARSVASAIAMVERRHLSREELGARLAAARAALWAEASRTTALMERMAQLQLDNQRLRAEALTRRRLGPA